jgi:hypothetical protein
LRATRLREHQLHVWISDDDRAFLLDYAEDRGETVGMTIRRLIRRLKCQSSQAAAVPFWSSQELVEALSPRFVCRFELFRAQAAQAAVTTSLIVERVDVGVLVGLFRVRVTHRFWKWLGVLRGRR